MLKQKYFITTVLIIVICILQIKAFVCPENMCENVKCEKIECGKDEIQVDDTCGCCKICQHQLGSLSNLCNIEFNPLMIAIFFL